MDLFKIWINLIIGIIGNLIFIGLIWIATRAQSSLRNHDPRKQFPSLVLLIILLPIVNFGLFIYILASGQSPIWLIIFPISFYIVDIMLWIQLNNFWKVGIRGVDQEIRNGINYLHALKMIKSELKFLGIGASKLTKESEFENAIRRCRSDISVKLLLCNPDDSNLKIAAKKYEKPEDEYKLNVINSLRKISDLKNNRGLNIEVKFYPKGFEPIFRLMFIDNSVCLFSYNIWGEGDGSQLPQLHILKAPQTERTVKSYYHPLELYFDNIWKQAAPWDFQEFLKKE